jgi:uncharacterized protein YggE
MNGNKTESAQQKRCSRKKLSGGAFSTPAAQTSLSPAVNSDFENGWFTEGEQMKRLVAVISLIAILLGAATVLMAAEVANDISVRGRLQRTVEPGGWVIASGTTKYLLINSRSFQSEEWFKEGTEVEAVGETKPDVVATFMEGTPFEARTLRPVTQTQTGSTDNRRFTRVLVTGDAIVQAQPDTAVLTISVVTQSKQAIDAQQQNATKSDAVMRAVKAAAGSGAEVKTSGYSLQPQRIYKEGQPPNIMGYEARNSVTVTMSDLTKVGSVIDAAGQAGANDLAGIAFTLRQDRPARDKALSEATGEAVSKARVIAQALGGKVVRVVEVQEEGFQRPPQPLYQENMMMRTAAAQPTPIQVGSLDISSRVQLVAEIEMNL